MGEGAGSLIHTPPGHRDLSWAQAPLERPAEAGPGEEAGGRRGWEGRSWSEEGPRAARPDPELHRPLPAVGHASLQACEPMSDSSGPGQRAFPAQGSPLSCAPASRGIWQGFPMTSQETRQSPELCRHLHLGGGGQLSGDWALGTLPC